MRHKRRLRRCEVGSWLLGVYYYYGYFCCRFEIAGWFYCYVPEEGVFVAAFALGYCAGNYRGAQQARRFLGACFYRQLFG